MLSWAKVEKVVKPPHSPVVSSRHHELYAVPDLWNRANRIPKMKHPKTFTVSVPQGNPWAQ